MNDDKHLMTTATNAKLCVFLFIFFLQRRPRRRCFFSNTAIYMLESFYNAHLIFTSAQLRVLFRFILVFAVSLGLFVSRVNRLFSDIQINTLSYAIHCATEKPIHVGIFTSAGIGVHDRFHYFPFTYVHCDYYSLVYHSLWFALSHNFCLLWRTIEIDFFISVCKVSSTLFLSHTRYKHTHPFVWTWTGTRTRGTHTQELTHVYTCSLPLSLFRTHKMSSATKYTHRNWRLAVLCVRQPAYSGNAHYHHAQNENLN